MATITPTVRYSQASVDTGSRVAEFYGTSAANSADTMTTPTVKAGSWKLLSVAIHYSAAPTYTATGLTIGIDSGISASFDRGLFTGSTNNAQDVVYLPDPDIRIIAGDAFVIVAPAGGGVITSSIVVSVLAS